MTTAVAGEFTARFYHARLMAKTLVTGGTGFLGSTSSARSPRAATICGCWSASESNSKPLEGIEFERAGGDVTRPRRRCAGRWRASSASSTSPAPPRCAPAARDRVFEVNVEGTRNVIEEALRAGVEQGGAHLGSSAVGRPAKPGEHRRRGPALHRGRSASPTSTPSTRPRWRRCGSPRDGLARGDRQPVVRARPRRPQPRAPRTRWSAGSCCAASRPTSTARLNIVDVRDVAQGPPARRRARGGAASATSSPAATSRSAAALRRPRRIAGVPPPPVRLPGAPTARWRWR